METYYRRYCRCRPDSCRGDIWWGRCLGNECQYKPYLHGRSHRVLSRVLKVVDASALGVGNSSIAPMLAAFADQLLRRDEAATLVMDVEEAATLVVASLEW